MSYLEECTRVYVPRGRVAHLIRPGDAAGLMLPGASLCGHGGRCGWLGTGSQDEHEAAARLPLCSRCAYLAGAG